jgi:hypothetical protein
MQAVCRKGRSAKKGREFRRPRPDEGGEIPINSMDTGY